MVLTGLRGVGKTVLLNALRSAAVRAGWGTGKIEARPEQRLRRPLSAALHMAVRELSPSARRPSVVEQVLGVLKAFALRRPARRQAAGTLEPGHRRAGSAGRADSGDIEIDLVELFTDVGGLASDRRWRGRAVHRRDAGPARRRRVGALRGRPRAVPDRCAADRGGRRAAAPAGGAVGVEVVLGAAVPLRPHRPAGPGRRSALLAPAEREDATWSADALDALYDASGGYPYFVQAYGKAAWDDAGSARSPPRRQVAAPEAEAELAVGFFGSRYERATPAERDYLRAMADLTEGRDEPVPPPTSPIPAARKPRRSRRPATACSRRGWCSPRSAARSRSPCRTSAVTCSPTAPELHVRAHVPQSAPASEASERVNPGRYRSRGNELPRRTDS